MKKREIKPKAFSAKKLREEILTDAKALGVPEGSAEMVAGKVVGAVAEWAAKRAVMTETDLYLRVAEEMKKYNSDLAYVYENRGKII